MKHSARFTNQAVLITGASSGIGRASALAFASDGARVILVARSKDKLNAVKAEISERGGAAVAIPTDVSSQAAVNAMVDQAVRAFGRIDILFNNAGTGQVGAVDDPRFLEQTQSMLDTSLAGAVYSTQAVLPLMKQQGGGTIINMSSVMGRKAFPRFGAYAITMHAMSAFSDALRQELHGTNIRVSTIYPALTQTAMLEHVDPAAMPPPFRWMTPLDPNTVAIAVLIAAYRGTPRVVLPLQPTTLLFGDALSPRIGDFIARLLATRAFSSLIGLYSGRTYHHSNRLGAARTGSSAASA